MTAPKECLMITPAVAAALGKSVEELSAMTLGRFRELAYMRGYDVRVSGFDERVPSGGSLTVKMDSEGRPILHAHGQSPQT